MANDTESIETLIDLMARVPGLGPRSARRAVLALLRKRGGLMTRAVTLPAVGAVQQAFVIQLRASGGHGH